MTAVLLPNAEQTFWDRNGLPLAGGQVFFYVLGTTTKKTTWRDSAKTIPNANPVVLDSDGRAIIYGEGDYRQVVIGATGITEWDQPTSDGFGAQGVANFSILIPGALTPRTLGAIFSDEYNVKNYGAIGDGTIDDTAAWLRTIMLAQATGGSIFAPYGKYKILHLLAFTAGGIQIRGSGVSGTTLVFNNGAEDCISVVGTAASQLNGFKMEGLAIQCNSKTGGRTFVTAYSHGVTLRDVECFNVYTGMEFYQTNWVLLDNVLIEGIAGGGGTNFNVYGPWHPPRCYGIFWHAPADGTGRSDQLTTNNVLVQGKYLGADGYVWDGMAQTWNMNTTTALGCFIGLYILNSQVSTQYFPAFLVASNFVTDGAIQYSIYLSAGLSFKFSNCDISNTTAGGNGGNDRECFVIDGDLSGSNTREVQISNSRIGQSHLTPLWIRAKNVQIVGCTFHTGVNMAAGVNAIYVLNGSQDVTVVGNQFTIFGDPISPNQFDHCLYVEAGSSRVVVGLNTFYGCLGTPVHWENNDSESVDQANSYGSLGGTPGYLQDPAPFTIPTSIDIGASGGFVVAAVQWMGGILTLFNGTNPGGCNLTTDIAQAFVANLQSPMIGKTLDVLVQNVNANPLYITGGAGVTMSGNLNSPGTFLIPAASQRLFRVRFNNMQAGAESVTFYG